MHGNVMSYDGFLIEFFLFRRKYFMKIEYKFYFLAINYVKISRARIARFQMEQERYISFQSFQYFKRDYMLIFFIKFPI